MTEKRSSLTSGFRNCVSNGKLRTQYYLKKKKSIFWIVSKF